MANAGFLQQRSASPARLGLVAAGHAAVLAAVMFAAGPQFLVPHRTRTTIYQLPLPQPPPVEPQPKQQEEQRTTPQRPQTVIPEQRIELPPLPPVGPQVATRTGGETVGPRIVADPPRQPDPPAPVRRGAEVDPRFASALQPQYPLAEQRAGRGGTVIIRVTIGADGRVRAAERVSATSDAFWAAAERQALTRWRFRPATVDGRPVESSKVMTIHFRIEDV